MLLLKFLTADSFIKCCNYEVFTDFVWPLYFYYEKTAVISNNHNSIRMYYHIMSIAKYMSH